MTSQNNFSDITLECGHRQWHVHRLILGSHSRVLAQACAEGPVIELHQEEENLLDALVQFLYTLDYDVPVPRGHTPLLFHVQMAELADQFDIEDMKHAAMEKIRGLLSTPEPHDMARLAEAIGSAYISAATPTIATIRKGFVVYTIGCYAEYIGDENRGGNPLRTIMRQHEQFAEDLAERIVDETLWFCPRCDGEQERVDIVDPTAVYRCLRCGRGRIGRNWMRNSRV